MTALNRTQTAGSVALDICGGFFGFAIQTVASVCGVTQIYACIKWSQLRPGIDQVADRIAALQQELSAACQEPAQPQDATALRVAALSRQILEKQQEKAELEYDLHTKLWMAVPLFGPLIAAIKSAGDTLSLQVALGQLITVVNTCFFGIIRDTIHNNALFPGCDYSVNEAFNLVFEKVLRAERHFVEVRNRDNSRRQIEAWYVRGIYPNTQKELPEQARTVILYHGNAMIGSGFWECADTLSKNGFNVYVPTMGGAQYGQSHPNHQSNNTHATDELSLYAEVDADHAFLKAKGVTELIPIGLSIGGVKAFQMALKYGRLAPTGALCKGIISDQAFSSGKEVTKNIAHNVSGLGTFSLGILGAAVGEMLFTYGAKDPVNNNTTDGLSNISKAQLLRGYVPLLACRATRDMLMGKGARVAGRYERDFAHDLVRAATDEPLDNHVLSLEGPHSSPWTRNGEISERIMGFLNEKMPLSGA